MILFKQGLILSAAAAGAPLDFTRIGWQTFTRGLTASSVTVSGETEEGPRDAPLDPENYSFWLAPSMPATWQLNLGALRQIDYVGILGGLGSAGAAVLAETSEDAVVWTTFSTGEAAPADDAPIMMLDELLGAQYLRLTFTGDTPPQLDAVYVGEALTMQLGPAGPHGPLPLSRDTVRRSSTSRGGKFLGSARRSMGVAGEISFRGLDDDWVRDEFDPFVKAARDFPYFIGWNPRRFPKEVAYVWTDEDIKPRHTVARQMEVKWAMRGVGHE